MRYWLLVLMLLPGVASATAYKCMNADGGTVYSTTPCEDVPGLVPYVEQAAASAGKLVLHMGADHSYRIPGTINGSPVTLMLDTGALRTTVSEGAAAAAGIQGCDRTGHAGGAARRCAVRVHEISFGGFELNDVVVDITPNLPVDALLGKDALRRLRVSQADGALYISRK